VSPLLTAISDGEKERLMSQNPYLQDRQFFPIKGVYTFALRVRSRSGNILSMVAVLRSGL